MRIKLAFQSTVLLAVAVIMTPLQLGPAKNNATSGNFGSVTFTIANGRIVDIVAPNSGRTSGETTVQAFFGAAPEPAMLTLMGGTLLGLGLLPRKAARGNQSPEKGTGA
jgi:hypothetical protein